MTTQTQVPAEQEVYVEPWPPHDTEESVLGTDLHQTAIRNFCWDINEAAHLEREPGKDLPWKAWSQTALLGCRRRDGSLLRTYPDLFVYTHFIDPSRGSVSTEVEGPPVLIVEVLSEATYESDTDLDRGKGYSYARAGVREYLTLDLTGSLVPEIGRGWRLEQGSYRSLWNPESDGRWHSQAIGVSIGLEGGMATVYTRGGRRLLREGEVEDAIAARDHAIAAQEETIARQAAEIEDLRRRLEES